MIRERERWSAKNAKTREGKDEAEEWIGVKHISDTVFPLLSFFASLRVPSRPFASFAESFDLSLLSEP